ncbi:hypothetical protein D0T49_12470 [Paludibacter sp. 221]|uniref:BT0820 family HAD-type phosphatase n=1 Tax=Paludibacter sp. 221 TaxID=2302939 RepID=UPI0013D853F5|nr:hypothetical protein [Paludibacter sp. 221]NDV47861.1 hypothetical protein [Paludibacter sp. 221]
MVIAVDFDGTIVTHEYPLIGKEIPFAIDTLKRLQTEFHHLLILWTVREGQELEDAVEFCRKRGLEFYAVNANYPEAALIGEDSRKVNADLFIDDKNLGGIPDWGVIYRMIAEDRCYQPPKNEIANEYPKKKGFFSSLFGK